MNNGKSISLNCAWGVKKSFSGEYYIAYTHWIYLDFITKKFSKVYLVTTCSRSENIEGLCALKEFKNLVVIEIPNKGGMLKSLSNFPLYLKTYRDLKDKVDLCYCRIPDPFPWIPKLFFKKDCIMHFVGDSIEAATVNEKWSPLKKKIMIWGYLPELKLTLSAARKSTCYCNGLQIADKYKSVKITPLISSTLTEQEICDESCCRQKDPAIVHLVFTGFLRGWKGIGTIIQLIRMLVKESILFTFDIIGSGDMYEDLKQLIEELEIQDKVKLHGFVNDRKYINDLYKKSDIYVFPSLGGEGSPRSVLEAMAQGLLVASSRVGSLGSTFKDGESICFQEYNDAEGYFNLIKDYQNNPEKYRMIKLNALSIVRTNYTRDKFLSTVFNVE